jgi:hypothetical protein
LYLPIVVLLVLAGVTITSAPILAQTGSATSSAMPSDATPNIGQQIDVEIRVDVTGVNPPDNALGSFTASLDWNPAVLAYHSNSGLLAGFTGVVNDTSVAAGHMVFNGIKVTGTTGSFVIFRVTFGVVGVGVSALDLEYSSMAAAGTFANLMPILTVHDGHVEVSPADRVIFLPIATHMKASQYQPQGASPRQESR